MIGRSFTNTRRVVVLVEDDKGVQHGFDLEGASVRWEWTGIGGSGPRLGEGSTGRVVVEGRFHRKSIDPEAQQVFDRISAERAALPAAVKEITDGQ